MDCIKIGKSDGRVRAFCKHEQCARFFDLLEEWVMPGHSSFTHRKLEGDHDRKRIEDAVERILRGMLSSPDFPRVNILSHEVRLCSLDNQLLWVFKTDHVLTITSFYKFLHRTRKLMVHKPELKTELLEEGYFPASRGHCRTSFKAYRRQPNLHTHPSHSPVPPQSHTVSTQFACQLELEPAPSEIPRPRSHTEIPHPRPSETPRPQRPRPGPRRPRLGPRPRPRLPPPPRPPPRPPRPRRPIQIPSLRTTAILRLPIRSIEIARLPTEITIIPETEFYRQSPRLGVVRRRRESSSWKTWISGGLLVAYIIQVRLMKGRHPPPPNTATATAARGSSWNVKAMAGSLASNTGRLSNPLLRRSSTFACKSAAAVGENAEAVAGALVKTVARFTIWLFRTSVTEVYKWGAAAVCNLPSAI